MSKDGKKDEKKPVEGKARQYSRKFTRFAIDASKLAASSIAQKTLDELKKTVVKPVERPPNEGRVRFVQQVRPTKTYARAARQVGIATQIREREQARNQKTRAVQTPIHIKPGLDGLVSFSILMAPMGFLMGLLYVLFPDNIPELFIFLVLFIWCLFIAIPGAYLGLDAIFMTSKYVGKGFWETFVLFFHGMGELVLLFFGGLAAIFRGAFESFEDWWAFMVSFFLSAGIIYYVLFIFLADFFPENAGASIVMISLLVLFPALLPASFAHRAWRVWWDRKMYTYGEVTD